MAINNSIKIKDLSNGLPKIKQIIDLSSLDNEHIDQVNNELLQSNLPLRTTINNTFTPNQDNKPSIKLKTSNINLDGFEFNQSCDDSLIDIFSFKDQDCDIDNKEK